MDNPTILHYIDEVSVQAVHRDYPKWWTAYNIRKLEIEPNNGGKSENYVATICMLLKIVKKPHGH